MTWIKNPMLMMCSADGVSDKFVQGKVMGVSISSRRLGEGEKRRMEGKGERHSREMVASIGIMTAFRRALLLYHEGGRGGGTRSESHFPANYDYDYY
jgi:hypothetical protein